AAVGQHIEAADLGIDAGRHRDALDGERGGVGEGGEGEKKSGAFHFQRKVRVKDFAEAASMDSAGASMSAPGRSATCSGRLPSVSKRRSIPLPSGSGRIVSVKRTPLRS